MTQTAVADILVREGLLDAAGLKRVLEIQARDGGLLVRIAHDLGLAKEDSLSRAIAKALRLDYVTPETERLLAPPELCLPAEFCYKRRILPLEIQGRSLRLLMADPLDHSTIQDVEFRTDKWVVAAVATETAILQALKRRHRELDDASLLYDLLPNLDPEGEVEESSQSENQAMDPNQLAHDVNLPPIVRLVNLALSNAAKMGASDIHVEPQEDGLQVRYRVDGILQDAMRIPKRLQQSMISRLKIISGMDIAERRKPQDGRSRLRFEQRKIDLRVSTLPANFGETVVIRLLDTASARLELDQIEFTPENLRKYQELLARPQGLILVTGPTGSGKSSTLYASLNWIKSGAKNIITVEDPIEYMIRGVNQVQINRKTGMTFAAGLRSILRQDPNIIMVGEIRDQETARIALEAAQTGHLLLSTLHTNDAPSSIIRLIDLGMEPFIVASSVSGIVAQRLVRRVCAACATERPPAASTLERIGGPACVPADARWKSGPGCEDCGHTGYRGRLAIHEILAATEEVREQIAERASVDRLRETARQSGMRTLMEDGIAKAARGLTTLEEVLRVAPPDPARKAAKGMQSTTQERAETADATPSTAGSGPKERVLIVDDSPTVVTVVKYFLELEGFEVLVAQDGLAGLEMARKQVPQVVVSDLNMPGMDGISLVRALREDPLTQDMAILVLTSQSSVESEARGLASGADDYIAKPVEPRRLAARIKAVLARARGRQTANT
ncbi:MAG: type II/IV secretion system protein [Acidobacteriota bacterium]